MADSAGTLLQQAVEHHRSGNLTAAESLYRRALEAFPNEVEVRYLLGTVQLQQAEIDDCIATLTRVIQQRPDWPDAHNNLGVAYKAAGQWEAAARAFQSAAQADPRYEQAFFNLGKLMEDRGLAADAAKCYRHVLALNAEDDQSRRHLANVLKQQGDWHAAERCYRELLKREPESLDLLVNLGFVLAKQERLDDAIDVYRTLLELNPGYFEIHNNLCYVFERQGKLEEAIQAALRALELEPNSPDALNNLGTALRSARRLDEACDCFQRALQLRPGFALAEFNYGTTRLLEGNYRDGWPGYRRHAQAAGIETQPAQAPLWDGESLPGKRLLVFADQGFGDTIQFARFLGQVKQRFGGTVILACQSELKTVLAGFDGADEVLADSELPSDADRFLPLADVPGLLNVELQSLASSGPYLRAAELLPDELRDLLGSGEDGALRVGLVWQGNPRQARDVIRSCPLDRLNPLFDVPGVSLFNLQTGEVGRRQLSGQPFKERLIDLGARLRTFAETAAVLDELDLLITVDTAAAHLAGALGRPVWTMLCYAPDWRWHLDRSDSPWYPEMRLYRQPEWGDWDSVVEQVAADLTALAESKS